MDHFNPKDGVLHCEDVPVSDIAEGVGTPVYIYSQATLERHARVFCEALENAGVGEGKPIHIAFAIKSNPNLGVLRVLANCGYGADVVSAGEMNRALAAGIAPEHIVFSGVGKARWELEAAIEAGIGQINIELEDEGRLLSELAAAKGVRVPATLRVNPNVDAGTHAKISTGQAEAKFGVGIDVAPGIYDRLAALPGLDMRGVAVHIGSQLANLSPLEAAFGRIGELVAELRAAGHAITHVDLGGGLGVPYKAGEQLPTPDDYAAMVARATAGWGVTLMFEPGRVIAGNAGVLMTRVLYVKPGARDPFVIVDAAMNDLARPALYDAWHDFHAVEPRGGRMTANIVGPVCESGDTFAIGRDIDRVVQDDLAIFRTAGAYGATMASSYNSRGLVPEVLVSGKRWAVVADRIPSNDLMAAERVPEWLED